MIVIDIYLKQDNINFGGHQMKCVTFSQCIGIFNNVKFPNENVLVYTSKFYLLCCFFLHSIGILFLLEYNFYLYLFDVECQFEKKYNSWCALD